VGQSGDEMAAAGSWKEELKELKKSTIDKRIAFHQEVLND